MSEILNGLIEKTAIIKFPGTALGDPINSDAAGMRKRVQQRLLDCILLRKYEEAMLLLDALLVETQWSPKAYWKVIIPIVQHLFPEYLNEVINGAFNSLGSQMNEKPTALALLIRKLACQDDEEGLRDLYSSYLHFKNPMVHTMVALMMVRKPEENSPRSEDPKTYKRTRITPKNIYMSDSEPYTSDSDEEQPRRKRKKLKSLGKRPKKRNRRESNADVKFLDEEDDLLIDKELDSTTTVHSEDSGYSDTDATDGEEEGEAEEEESSSTTDNEEEEELEEDNTNPDAKVIKWSMPPRLHYIDSTGYNYKSLHQLLVNASRGYMDLTGVKLRLKIACGRVLRERETKFQLIARRYFYELLSDAMLHVDNNAPLIRILLPYFSHYSEEWLQLMEKYCHLDATADLAIGLERLERRCRKIVAANPDDQPKIQARATTMVRLLLQRISHGCFEEWTFDKLIKWMEMLDAEVARAPKETASLITDVIQRYFTYTQ
ncbi:hypothetical protein INT44_000663 [Umbelopsis vinacea]|uniref:Uncharacterized protein n=1 Tax=Umbelopsis vinacea TaxID=44442 RepID=A0A8H7UQ34_9FUNG|nr:hypothetical protein INT44_000663 [Umbelopsis vinacea]